MTGITVVGAGMAGLLAAGMLRGDCSGVLEAQPSLPNNHSAVLRFRSSVVGDVLNIPFRKVRAVKAIQPWRNPIADALMYSRKTNGTATLRSIASADATISERFIAPPDLISRMANRVSAPVAFGASADHREIEGSVISTVPMPVLMDSLGWEGERPAFSSVSGKNFTATVAGADAYCSLYVPDPELPFTRVSLTGSKLVAECYEWSGHEGFSRAQIFEMAAEALGLDPTDLHERRSSDQKYGKILPIDEAVRREFIVWASEEHGVYPLGRFATWRPGLLLDDVVNDVRVIQRLVKSKGEAYAHKLKG